MSKSAVFSAQKIVAAIKQQLDGSSFSYNDVKYTIRDGKVYDMLGDSVKLSDLKLTWHEVNELVAQQSRKPGKAELLLSQVNQDIQENKKSSESEVQEIKEIKDKVIASIPNDAVVYFTTPNQKQAWIKIGNMLADTVSGPQKAAIGRLLLQWPDVSKSSVARLSREDIQALDEILASLSDAQIEAAGKKVTINSLRAKHDWADRKSVV